MHDRTPLRPPSFLRLGRAAASCALACALAAAPGCYGSHERGDVLEPGPCAPEGRHTVSQRVVRTTPGCGMIGGIGDLEVSIPPGPDTFMGAGEVDIVRTGPCRWDVHAATAIPDFVATTDGTIDTSDGTVRGTFEVSVTGLAGTTCEAALEWTERL